MTIVPGSVPVSGLSVGATFTYTYPNPGGPLTDCYVILNPGAATLPPGMTILAADLSNNGAAFFAGSEMVTPRVMQVQLF